MQLVPCRHETGTCNLDGSESPEFGTCRKESNERWRNGKRGHGIGRLRPGIVLFGEPTPNEKEIEAYIKLISGHGQII